MPACPPADTLSRFLLDVLSGDEPSVVEAHVEHCDQCQESLRRMAQLAAQPATEMMNSWRGGAVDVDVPPAVDRLLQELSAVPFAIAARMTDATAQEFPSTGQDELSADWPRVDGYEILGELGRGGMGVVYRARHLSLDRLVALKMIQIGSALNPHARQRFQQEARAVGRLQHPNIVQVYDVDEQAGRPFLAMELIEGGSLARRLGGLPQPPRPAGRLIETLARAVQYAHTHGIVHRDLKPANILLASGRREYPNSNGAQPAGLRLPLAGLGPKITDFGLAKDLAADAPALTHSGAMLGTPSYMAPEQARCRGEAVGPAADVYGLGAIMYELLTGRPPFRAATPLETLVLVVHTDPVPISRLEPSVPRDLVTICHKCLEKEPGRRYPSAEALADDLRRFLGNEPIVARSVGAIGRLRRWGRMNPALTAVLFSGAGLAAVALGIVLWQWRDAMEARAGKDQALVAARIDRDAADDARRQAERAAIGLRFDRGLSLCEQGDATVGLLSLAQSLDEAAKCGAADLESAIRDNIAAWAGRIAVPQTGPFQQGLVTAMAFSPDGRRLITTRSEFQNGKPGPGVAQLWDCDGWRPVGRPLLDPDPLVATACTPDGGRVVTCSTEGAVRVWDVATGAVLAGPFKDVGRMTTVAVSPDGRRFAAGGIDAAGHGEVRIWDTPDAKTQSLDSAGSRSDLGSRGLDIPAQRVLAHAGRVNAVVFSPDGKTIVTGYTVLVDGNRTMGGEAQVWDATTGAPHGRPLAHARPVTAVAVDPLGQVVLTGSADRVARLWNIETGRPLGIPRTNPFSIEAAAFSPDGKTIMTSGGWRSFAESNCGATLWDSATGRLLASTVSYPYATTFGAIRPDGRVLATANRDGRVRMIEVGGPRPLLDQRQPIPVGTAVFSSDGRFLLTGGGRTNHGRAQLWDLTTGQAAGPPFDHDAVVVALAFDPKNETVVTGSRNGAIRVWDVKTGQTVDSPQKDAIKRVPQTDAPATTFDPTGRLLMLFAREGPARRWGPATGRPAGALPLLDKTVTAVAFSADGHKVLIGDINKTIRLWDATTARALGPPCAAGAIPWYIAFSPDGTRFLTVAGDGSGDWGKVQVWDAVGMTTLGPLLPPRVSVMAAAFHPNGRIIATGGRDGDVRLWDGPTGRLIGPSLDHAGVVRAVAFDNAGQRLAVAGADGSIRVWPVSETMSGSPIEIRRRIEGLTGHELDVNGGVRAVHDAADRRSLSGT